MIRDNILQDWLRERFFYAEADALAEKNIATLEDHGLSVLVCNTIDIDIMTLCEHEADMLLTAVGRERKRLLYKQAFEKDGIFNSLQRSREFI